jgi:hypothetical protein
MPVTLSIQESVEEVISGIPKIITLTTDVPSTIFFTLDGSDPDLNSEMYIDPIVMPTDGLTIVLKAFALAGAEQSSVLERTYSTDHGELDRTRLINGEGINILPPDVTVVDNLAYDEDGSAAKETTIPFVDLDLKASTRSNIGEDISGNSTIDFINLPERTIGEGNPAISSPNDHSNFNPQASMIIIDGTTDAERDSQVVQIINRPYLSMDPVYGVFAENWEHRQLVTSSLVRAVKNPKTGIITFYYRDSRENRWIKSNQDTTPRTLDISPKKERVMPLVFRWVENRSQTKIF